MKFRLVTVLWVFALFAVGLATFGPPGLLIAGAALAFWMRFYAGAAATWRELLVVAAIGGAAIGLLIPAVDDARENARRSGCQGRLAQLALALQNYSFAHGALPPAAAPQTAGGPPRSWRLLLLPMVEQLATYNAYRHDEPWDSAGNRAIALSRLDGFVCPSHSLAGAAPPHTNYLAVVGPRAAFLSDRGRAWSEFTDDRSQTILLIEAAGQGAPWIKPKDYSFDEALALLTAPQRTAIPHRNVEDSRFFYKDESLGMMNVLFADGKARSLKLPLSRELAESLLTINGGESIDFRELNRATNPQLDYGKIYALVVFIALCLAPVVARHRRPSPKSAAADSTRRMTAPCSPEQVPSQSNGQHD